MAGLGVRLVSSLMHVDQWSEYFERLEGPEGCDFKEDAEKGFTWTCKGGMDKSKSTRILVAMGIPEDRVFGVLSYVEGLGGHCDCEVLFNAAERVYDHLGVVPNPFSLTPEQLAELEREEEERERSAPPEGR